MRFTPTNNLKGLLSHIQDQIDKSRGDLDIHRTFFHLFLKSCFLSLLTSLFVFLNSFLLHVSQRGFTAQL